MIDLWADISAAVATPDAVWAIGAVVLFLLVRGVGGAFRNRL